MEIKMSMLFPIEEPMTLTTAKVDVGSWGLRSHYDESEGRVYGLCTESLGSESSCDDGFTSEEEEINRTTVVEEEDVWKIKNKKEKKISREFPPPLPSLETRGPSFMKAVRDDGRLILKEVRYERPEILRATREDGRLRLHLVLFQSEEEETEQEEIKEQGEGRYELEVDAEVEERESEEEEEEEEEEEWRWTPRDVGGKRCQEMISHDPSIRRTINVTNNMDRALNMDHIAQLWRINSPRYVTTA